MATSKRKPIARTIVITVRDTDVATGKVELNATFEPLLKPGEVGASTADRLAAVMFRAAIDAANNGAPLPDDED